jgi:hypothetical protein
MKEIGGYFEFELLNKNVETPSMWFNSGRSAFAYLLKINQIKEIQLPHYTCDVMLEPLHKMNIKYSFYPITNSLLPDLSSFEIKPNVPMVLNNYFGVLDKELKQFAKCPNVIIDNAQALYSSVSGGLGSFNSFRKFIGVPDGAAAYFKKQEAFQESFPQNKTMDNLDHLFGRLEVDASSFYTQYQANDVKSEFKEIKQISEISSRTFKLVDHGAIKERRKENFNVLHSALGNKNELALSAAINFIPMVYPFLVKNGTALKKYLNRHKVYVASYWPNKKIRIRDNTFESYLTYDLVALPIDQRYSLDDMDRIINLINMI